MPEKLVMHPDMTDEEWARWDYVLSELSKTTSLAPFCSGISTQQQSESDVLPYEYDTLKTNGQVHRDAASVVPTSETAGTAAAVQRMVMRFLRFAINCFCVNESVISSDLKVVNMILAKEPQFVTATIKRKTQLDGSYSETFVYHLSKHVFFISSLTNRVCQYFSKRPIGSSGAVSAD
jgi:hypothetical protein